MQYYDIYVVSLSNINDGNFILFSFFYVFERVSSEPNLKTGCPHCSVRSRRIEGSLALKGGKKFDRFSVLSCHVLTRVAYKS